MIGLAMSLLCLVPPFSAQLVPIPFLVGSAVYLLASLLAISKTDVPKRAGLVRNLRLGRLVFFAILLLWLIRSAPA